ncbi:MAG: hypothetical protein ACQES4_05680 [Bacillota bacterium]
MTEYWDMQPLKKLLKMSEKLIKLTVDDFDYQLICDELHALAGAKFTVISIFDEKQENAENVALSGVSDEISQASELLRIQIHGARWKIISGRIGQLNDGKLKLFESLHEASSGNISEPVAMTLEKALNLGKTYAIGIADTEGNSLGEIAMVMNSGEEIQYPEAIEIYTGQIGLLLSRLKSEEALLKESARKS